MTNVSQQLFPIRPWARIVLLVLAALSAATGGLAQRVVPPSRIQAINGVLTLMVDDKPFFVAGAQCDVWRSTRQDAKAEAFFAGYEAMHATTVSVGVPWSRCEPTEGHYNFAFLDWFVARAQTHHLKLILNLFNSNVCGKVQEGPDNTAYPVYTPAYILAQPQRYQRMDLPKAWRYDAGGPPMCPNDPHTLDRETRYVVQVMEHLKRTDLRRTVIMVQLDNEFYYNQWVAERPPDETAVRCHCQYCETLWSAHPYSNGQEFMFHSFANYVRALTDAMTRVYPIPIYLNDPWWDPSIVPIFLNNCPNVALIGMDGVFDLIEPNVLSRSLLSRNIPFAAENPTEQPATRFNLDSVPYYTLIGREGIGNLLWECGPPHTIVDDPASSKRYADALAPLTAAMIPIARARGTARLSGWFTLRKFREGATDTFGNYVTDSAFSPVTNSSLFVRDGATTRVVSGDEIAIHPGGIGLRITGSEAGVAVQLSAHELILALAHGRVRFPQRTTVQAESGEFIGERWRAGGPVAVEAGPDGKGALVKVGKPGVVRVRF